MNEPWICPRCGTVYAPWVPSCSCKVVTYTDYGTTNPQPRTVIVPTIDNPPLPTEPINICEDSL